MDSNGFYIAISDCLIRFLGKSLPNRTSRFEAFQYLVAKQKVKVDQDFDGGVRIPFLAKVSDLSKRWNWSRNTVFSFLRTLENDGAIEVKQCQNGTLIRVLNIFRKDAKTSENNSDFCSAER